MFHKKYSSLRRGRWIWGDSHQSATFLNRLNWSFPVISSPDLSATCELTVCFSPWRCGLPGRHHLLPVPSSVSLCHPPLGARCHPQCHPWPTQLSGARSKAATPALKPALLPVSCLVASRPQPEIWESAHDFIPHILWWKVPWFYLLYISSVSSVKKTTPL